jgi:hypothetical protein
MRKRPYSVLIGNGINNIAGKNSWESIIADIGSFCEIDFKIDDDRKRNFPILYEEIFLSAARRKKIKEPAIKERIAQWAKKVEQNPLHDFIRSLKTKNIITTNYDFSLEGEFPDKNEGTIQERLYSVFRKYTVSKKNFWHVHGDCLYPQSINLGFEHYVGQTQNVRNYVATGTNYKSKKLLQRPLVARLKKKNLNDQSWVDLFFVSDLHIIGLTLDFIETDLWWLLTYRARLMVREVGLIENEIVYYIPEKYTKSAVTKIAMLEAAGVRVERIPRVEYDYYEHIFSNL